MSTATLTIIDGNGNTQQLAVEQSNGIDTPHSVPEIAGTPVSESNPLPVSTTPQELLAEEAESFEIITGGAPVTVFGASTIIGGAYITNPYNAVESLFVDPVNVPGTSAPGSFGTTTELVAGQSWTAPPGLTGAVYANAATSAHVFTAVRY